MCLALCSQNFGPAVCIRCVYVLQSCERSVVFPETGPGLGCLPGGVGCVCLSPGLLCIMPDSVLTVVCMAYVPYLDFWHVCLALYSEHVLGMCAPSVCLTLVSTFCAPDSIVFWRECLVCVISMCSGHVYLALCIRFRPWGVYRLLFLLWVPGMTLACVPACQAATAGLSCSPRAVCWCCLFANVFLARVSALPCLEGGPVTVRPVFPAPCVGPELCPCDMLPVM